MSEGVFEPVTELVEKVESEVSDLVFNPRPGGLVDTWQKEKARKEAAAEEARHEDEPVNQAAYQAVKVAQEAPEVVATNLVTIPPGGIAQILPASPYRYRASLIVVTAASSIVLSRDQGTALGGQGFPLPSGIVFPLTNRAQLWGYNSGGSAVQIATFSEMYGPKVPR